MDKTEDGLEALQKEIEARKGDAERRAAKAESGWNASDAFFRQGQVDAYEQVLALLAALQGKEGKDPLPGLVWTREKPMQAGWYWYRMGEDKPIEIAEVAMAGLGRFEYWSHFYDAYEPIPDGWIWAGPIPEPASPAPETGGDHG